MSLKKPHDDDADIGLSKKVTGKELTLSDEITTRLDTLVQLLQDKGIINKKEYESRVAMRLHETSKATAFEEMDEEI
jgi:predicted transcriptional regulator YheO